MAENIPVVAQANVLCSPQLAAIHAAVLRITGHVGTSAPSEAEAYAQIAAGLDQLGAEIEAARAQTVETEQRLGEVMDAMTAMSALDFDRTLPISDAENIFDAVALATNLLNEELRASVVSKTQVDDILAAMIDPLLVVGLDGTILTVNRAALALAAYQPDQQNHVLGQPVTMLFADGEAVAQTLAHVAKQGVGNNEEHRYSTKDGRTIPVSLSSSVMRDAAGQIQAVVCLARDITERNQAEEALRERLIQQEIIRTQSALLDELSTPLIPISDRVVVLPLIGTLDSRRMQQVLETLLNGISTIGADVVILDITGVAIVDTQVASGLVRAAQAGKLLGAQVALSGIRPEVAQTLVGLGIDLAGIATYGTLQSGIAAVLSRR